MIDDSIYILVVTITRKDDNFFKFGVLSVIVAEWNLFATEMVIADQVVEISPGKSIF